jgi:hypothetical protein
MSRPVSACSNIRPGVSRTSIKHRHRYTDPNKGYYQLLKLSARGGQVRQKLRQPTRITVPAENPHQVPVLIPEQEARGQPIGVIIINPVPPGEVQPHAPQPIQIPVVPIEDGVPASRRERAHVPPDPDVDRAMGGSLELPGLRIIDIDPCPKGGPEEEPGRARLEDVAAHDGRVISDGGCRILGRAAAGEEDTWLLQKRTRGLLRERAGDSKSESESIWTKTNRLL